MKRGFNWPAIWGTLALFIALGVRFLGSQTALVWVFFHIIACGLMVRDTSEPRAPRAPFIMAWLITILFCALVSATGVNVLGLTCALLAMPTLALCMKKKYLGGFIKGYGGVVAFYAALLIGEFVVRVKTYNPAIILDLHQLVGAAGEGLIKAASWPMIDPNNAALVINCALIPCFWKATEGWNKNLSRKSRGYSISLQKSGAWRYWALFTLFSAALLCTYSKTGIAAAGLICAALAVYRSEERWRIGTIFVASLAVIVGAVSQIPATNGLWNSTHQRMEIWSAAAQMLTIRPIFGIGLGEFGNAYQTLRTEHDTAGVFAHNDIMQIAIEMGWWAAAVFAAMWSAVSLKTCRANVAAAGVIMAVLLQSMLEFQFYVPAVSLLAGLALAYHSCYREPKGVTL